MATNNATILDRVRLTASSDYQQRIPLGVTDGAEAVQKALLDINNGQLFNEFVKGLTLQIGVQKAKQLSFTNPLAVFKTDKFLNGKTYQEYATRLIKPLQYNPRDPAGVLRNYDLPVESYFYKVNRKVVYPVTVNADAVKASFNNVESGLNDYLSLMLRAPWTSNQYDEFRFMLNTLAAANAHRPFYNVQCSIADVNNPTEVELKRLSRKLREFARKQAIAPSGLYNGAGIPTLVEAKDLVLFTTPEIYAGLEVEVLADAFNQTRVDFENRIIMVDEFPWAGTHAILADKEAIIAGDSLLKMTSFPNAYTDTENFFLHAQGGYAISALSNVIVFSNTVSTQVGVVEVELTSIEATWGEGAVEAPADTFTAEAGTLVELIVTATGTIDPENSNFVVPSNYTVEITSDAGDVSPRTYVDSTGMLFIDSATPSGSTLTVVVTAAYRNPSAALGTPTTAVTSTIELAIA